MSIELKIKAKSLAAEARIIREEEIKLKRKARYARERQNMAAAAHYERQRQSLYDHRIDIVRWECRATHLARAFMKGYAYKDIERNARLDPYTKGRLMGRVHKLLTKYYKKSVTAETVQRWFDGQSAAHAEELAA